ncbi:glutamate--cysteine ligase [Fusibacter paucivorans]|uniref:glutamate--cysteine ligase n=1 Tax=Fusibacter paucivorans TaxID=76009 RepID=A0ABS5PQZ2_9FIRM|nr:glutamate-cysteine ligase family protein [Fusibacter paucivorans]MBS7527573.1 glutamate--cysteine ligase [Fusibacter paucivorans]
MDAKRYTEAAFINKMTTVFRQRAVSEPSLLGVEFEHFLVDSKTLRSYAYDETHGQEALFKALSANGWDVLLAEKGRILGLKRNGHTLTLEPGGQIEISLKAYDTLAAIETAYLEVVNELKGMLLPSQRLVSLGYHPATKINELTLLPKQRYHLMYDYFKDHGRYCHNMMKGTASTQVSIDYKDEMDYHKKNRVAQMLSPIMASLFDSTPIFEGKRYDQENCRVCIWQQTDIKRSKFVKGSFDPKFGFEDYAAYLLALPPIVLKSNGDYYDTGDRVLRDLLNDYPLDDSDFDHLMGMVFPDVRLKGFLEIRMADAMPYPYNLSVPALIKAIFYDEALLTKYDQMANGVNETWVQKANEALLTQINPVVDGINFKEVKDMLLNDALMVLTPAEARPLMMLRSIANENGSIKRWLSEMYERDKERFLEVIAL